MFKLSPPPHRVKEPVTDVKTFLKTLHCEELEFVITFATKRSKGESVNFGFLKKASAVERTCISLWDSRTRVDLSGTFHIQEDERSIDPEQPRHGAKERKQYGKNKAKPVPRLKSIDELVDFFDKHDMGDYWDSLPKAEFEVNIKTRKHLVAIDEKIIPRINQIEKSKRVTSAKLINAWLREKIATSKRA